MLHILFALFIILLLLTPYLSTSIHYFLDPLTYSRNGREINILSTMKLQMPYLIMDCELWYGRGQFSLSYAMVSKSIFFSWDFLRYLLFSIDPSVLLVLIFG